MIRLECKDGGHFKFWEAEVKGSSLHVHFGRIGTAGQTKVKKLASPVAAQAELDKVMREKLAHGYVKKAGAGAMPSKASKPTKTVNAATKAKNSAAAEPLLALAELLAPAHAKTRVQVLLALSDPDAYKKKYREDLEDRNAEDDPVDPFLALVSALTKDGVELAAPVDWKDSAEDVQAAIERVIIRQRKLRMGAPAYDAKKALAFYDEDAHLRTKTDAFIALCGRALSAHGLALVELDISSDSHELCVLPFGDVTRAMALARKGGGALVSHAPKTPLAAPIAKAAPKGKPSAKIDKVRLAWNVHEDEFAQLPGVLRWIGYGVGEMDDRGKTYKVSTTKTLLVDCRAWPVKESPLGAGRLSAVFSENDGSKILHRVYHELVNDEYLPRAEGTLRIERPGKPAVDLVSKLPDEFDVEEVAWVGELAVIFPTEPTIRGTKTRRPLVWNGKTLSPAKGIPDLRPKKGTKADPWPSFKQAGFARTGDGADVIIWGGKAYVAKGETFTKVCDLVSDLDAYETTVGAPVRPAGFVYAHIARGKTSPKRQLRHAEKGRCTERAKLAHLPCGPARGTPDGRVLVGLIRGSAKTPALVVLHPEENQLTYVPATMLGIRKDDQADAFGVAPASAKGGAYLWAWSVQDDILRRVSWDAVLALPRRPAM